MLNTLRISPAWVSLEMLKYPRLLHPSRFPVATFAGWLLPCLFFFSNLPAWLHLAGAKPRSVEEEGVRRALPFTSLTCCCSAITWLIQQIQTTHPEHSVTAPATYAQEDTPALLPNLRCGTDTPNPMASSHPLSQALPARTWAAL